MEIIGEFVNVQYFVGSMVIPEGLRGSKIPEIIDWNLEVWIIELC